MAVRIEVSGADALKTSLRDVFMSIEDKTARAVEAEADAVVQDARSHVRVDEGDLQDSIEARVDGLSADVAPFSAQPFIKALVNEFGRTRDPGQPYMTPAAEASRARWPTRAEEAANRAIKGG